MLVAQERVPATIVTGFLGSGKTTLLNHLLSVGGLGRVAALVNDFGAIDIDAALVSEVADEVVQLSNGCICCTINGDLYGAVERVLALTPQVERIVIETTGLADPLPVGLTLLQTDLRGRCVLEAVVTVVDCANFALDLFAADAAMAQIVHADIVVLNKTDLVDAAATAALEQRIAVIKPRARLLRAEFGRAPIAAILSAPAERSITPWTEGGAASAAGGHLLADGFAAHAVALDAPVSAPSLQAWLTEGLPEAVFRAKGLIRLDRPAGWFVFQLCGGRASFEPFLGTPARGGLVFIGRDLDPQALEARARACLVAAPADADARRAVAQVAG
ncbi:MAG TPA: GTP-binding protein [Caulobacteraceae bacterium]|jgi:G3E family GTPase